MRTRLHAITSTGAFTAWASLVLALAGVGAALVLTIGYVQKVDQAAEERNVKRQREICGIVRLIDDRNQTMPPADDATAEFRRELHAYRVSLGC
jgi:uncharacterized protein (DUF1501 family)